MGGSPGSAGIPAADEKVAVAWGSEESPAYSSGASSTKEGSAGAAEEIATDTIWRGPLNSRMDLKMGSGAWGGSNRPDAETEKRLNTGCPSASASAFPFFLLEDEEEVDRLLEEV